MLKFIDKYGAHICAFLAAVQFAFYYALPGRPTLHLVCAHFGVAVAVWIYWFGLQHRYNCAIKAFPPDRYADLRAQLDFQLAVNRRALEVIEQIAADQKENTP